MLGKKFLSLRSLSRSSGILSVKESYASDRLRERLPLKFTRACPPSTALSDAKLNLGTQKIRGGSVGPLAHARRVRVGPSGGTCYRDVLRGQTKCHANNFNLNSLEPTEIQFHNIARSAASRGGLRRAR